MNLDRFLLLKEKKRIRTKPECAKRFAAETYTNMWTSSNTSVNQQFSTNDAGNQPTIMENGGLGSSSAASSSSSSAKSYFSSGGLLNHHQDAATNPLHDSAGDYYNACQINSNSGEGRSDALNGQIGYYYNHQNQTSSQTAQQYFFNGGLNFDYNSFIAEPSEPSYDHHQVTTASNSSSSGCGNSSRSSVAMTTAAASLRHLYQTEPGHELEQGQMASTHDQRHQYDSSPSSSTPLALNHVHQLYYSANSSAHFCSNYHLYSQMSINPNTNLSTKSPSDDVEQGQLCSSKMKEIANRLTLSSSSSNDATALSINPSFIQAASYSAEQSIPLLGSSSQEEPGSYTSDVATPSKSAQNSSNSNESSHKKSYSGKSDQNQGVEVFLRFTRFGALLWQTSSLINFACFTCQQLLACTTSAA